VRPFEYAYHAIVAQRGNVTITNNVIHPANGESAYLHYVMPKEGKISITVFTLSGDIVNVLANGTQNAGEYTTGWDGKNRGGRIVARGIYFVRVVGPGFDEMRKVLVVR
ncbi:MAG TPA: FlgD immunoglobulin-like domain containing protein, partial [Spirochaetia bacterium]|nr:FlgD immunoglobulin-like domain containing protein [Spirochaetia bacterium]